MKKVFALFSHTVLEDQKKELKERYSCEEVVYLPKELQVLWSNVEVDSNHSEKFSKFLEENSTKEDLVIIQGEWGLVYKMINFAKKIGLIPIYSFSRRVSTEKVENGTVVKTSCFKHIEYKEYE